MKPVNSITTSFVKISTCLDKRGNLDEYRIFESMLSEDERECLRQLEAMKNYKKQKPITSSEPSTTGKKRGRKKKVVAEETKEATAEEPPVEEQKTTI
jgi:hypothetical protein